MKKSVIPALCLIGLAALCPARTLEFKTDSGAYLFDPETLALEYESDGKKISLSSPFYLGYKISSMRSESESASWKNEFYEARFSCRVVDNAFELTVDSIGMNESFGFSYQTLDSETELIFAKDSGLYLSLDDPLWRDHLVNSEWNTHERMSMPVWGFISDGYCASWMVSTPFRNTITFLDTDSGELDFSFSHRFSYKSPERKVTIRVIVDEEYSPVTPAIRYREWLDKTGHVTTLEEKAEIIPAVNKLKGAPHLYLWGDSLFTVHDVVGKKWKAFSQKLLGDSSEPGTISAKLKASFTDEQWNQVVEYTSTEWPYKYMKQEISNGISAALVSETLYSEAADEITRARENSTYFHEGFQEFVLPPDQWGSGDSVKMMESLASLGFDKLKLCVPGWESLMFRPSVVEKAESHGWLFGTYDSYHSIHDPATKGSDQTWTTAQMTEELWQNGGVMNEDRSYKRGFKGIGKKLNPFVARPFYEKRISENLDSVPFNYYFIDCDAYGEVYDDYHPEHSNSKEEDAGERTRRLKWLSEEKGLVVGSEGGNVYALEGVHVLEGTFGPYFGWGDEDMKDSESEYFRGKYYPPDEPAINFKPVPIKEEFRKLYYDPSVRIPLFQTAFHDAVITTHHWSNDRFKYPDLISSVELTEILWMCPPMVHMNYNTVSKRGKDLKTHTDSWSPLHEKLAFQKLLNFEYLDESRLVQQTTWEDGTVITADFSEGSFKVDVNKEHF